MMLRSRPEPDLKIWRPLLAATLGVLLPAIPAFLVLWGSDMDVRRLVISGDSFRHLHWLLPVSLSSSAFFAWLIIPVITPFIWILARLGWAGPLSLVLMGLLIGLPGAHVFFHGDLTTEAPDLLPLLMLTITIQALCGWCVLHLLGLRAAPGRAQAENQPAQK